MLTTYARRRSASPVPFLAVFGFVFVAVLFQMARGLPRIASDVSLPPATTLGQSQPIPWPTTGATVLAVKGLGPIGSSNDAAPRPIASVTKMMTGFLVLKDHPLNPGEKGSSYTITAADVTAYRRAIALDESAIPVVVGQQFTQYEMLQALLVPSANNFADILAAWDAGTVQAFVDRMNQEAAALGMRSTIYADPSGFSAATKSTASDQLLLAQKAMANPVFAEIVGMASARLPGTGTVSNVNAILGQEGIAGIKTGFTEDAGDCLAFYAKRQVNGQPVEVFGVTLGMPSRPAVFDSTKSLVSFTGNSVQTARVVSANQVVASVKPRWGKAVPVVVAQDTSMLLWPGMTLQTNVELQPVRAPLAAGSEVGVLHLKLGDQESSVPLKLATSLEKPGIFWRLTRL